VTRTTILLFTYETYVLRKVVVVRDHRYDEGIQWFPAVKNHNILCNILEFRALPSRKKYFSD
jgi:hypothetical protein